MLVSTLATSAHELGRLVVEPPVVAPGDAINVHGDALWTESPVTVTLVDGSGTQRTVATSVTSAAGALEIATRVPDDLATGTWEVVVANDAGEHVEGQVIVRSSIPIAALVGGAVVVAATATTLIAAIVVARRRGTPDTPG